jgi:hypothetical protein
VGSPELGVGSPEPLLRPGAVLEVSITKQGEIGKYTRYGIRKRRPPKRIDRCLLPGVTNPTACPSP